MPKRFSFSFEENANSADKQKIEDGLKAYNRRFVPADNFRELNIFVSDKNGEVLGGLLGATYWGWLYVSMLWLDESLRGEGLGTQLLTMAEIEAENRGCQHAHLDTMDFQALPFYQKLGYTVFGQLDDLPLGHTRYFLQKKLG